MCVPVLVLAAGNGVYPLAEGSSDDTEGAGTSRILEVLRFLQLISSVLDSFDLKEAASACTNSGWSSDLLAEGLCGRQTSTSRAQCSGSCKIGC